MYDLQDAGYDADIIREFSIKHNHRPIIDINPKNCPDRREEILLGCQRTKSKNRTKRT